MLEKVILIMASVCCVTAAINSPACARDSQSCFNNRDCCSNTCYLNKCSSLDQVNSTRVVINPDIDSVSDRIASRAGGDEPKVETQTEPQEEGTSLRDEKPTTDGSECKQIAQNCHSNDECCTKRCHGYLHQCVI